MNKHRVKETALKFPLVYNIVKANLQDTCIYSKDIEYGNHKRHYYRVFNCKENSPIIFFVHGGSWWHGSPKRYSYVGKFFNKKGFTVVLISYRLVPGFTYPVQIDDIFKGFKHFLKNEYVKGDRDKVYIMGYSAGGELASNLVFNKYFQEKYNVDKTIFKKFVSISGVLDFTKCTRHYAKTIIKNYTNNKDLNINNPVNLIDGNEKIPVLCIHGRDDSLINPECSMSFIGRINNPQLSKLVILNNMYHSNILNIIRGKGKKESNIILDFLN
ncbi:MAG: alpha/beta hydrolase [Romboutsia sp.]